MKQISDLWCKNFHTRAMWPIRGRYICPQCLRQIPVGWEHPVAVQEPLNAPRRLQLGAEPRLAMVAKRGPALVVAGRSS